MNAFRSATRTLLLAIVSVVGVFALAACGSDTVDATSADLSFTDVWTRMPVEGQSTSAVYATVSNSGATDVRITGAATDVTDRVELHMTTMEDGLMTMSEQPDGFVVPAGGSFVFEPGGPHVMLFDIDPATYPSDALDITFSFDAGDPATFTASVREIEGAMHSKDMDMDDGAMDDSDS